MISSKPDPKECLDSHKVIGGVVLCQKPTTWDYGNSLSPSVTCMNCRDYWHFRVNAESYRVDYATPKCLDVKSCYTHMMDSHTCNCCNCRIYFRNLFK